MGWIYTVEIVKFEFFEKILEGAENFGFWKSFVNFNFVVFGKDELRAGECKWDYPGCRSWGSKGDYVHQ